MFKRLLAIFDGTRCQRATTLPGLIVSDYLAYYGAWVGPHYKMRTGIDQPPRPESPRRLALLFVPRLLNNPCLHATLLLRIATHSPRALQGLCRTVLLSKHSIDMQPTLVIGPGLVLPHPVGIVFGAGARIGRGVAITHMVTIGGDPKDAPDAPQLSPRIGDGVVIYTQSIVIGGITVGDGAVIGARSWVAKDVAPGSVHTGKP